ncbi:hypothetical protein [Anaerocolumna chitinilytica]|nr:hypothetical protein [Anaerocolumna chitinilytica]
MAVLTAKKSILCCWHCHFLTLLLVSNLLVVSLKLIGLAFISVYEL